jgi:hypothetical protein
MLPKLILAASETIIFQFRVDLGYNIYGVKIPQVMTDVEQIGLSVIIRRIHLFLVFGSGSVQTERVRFNF